MRVLTRFINTARPSSSSDLWGVQGHRLCALRHEGLAALQAMQWPREMEAARMRREMNHG